MFECWTMSAEWLKNTISSQKKWEKQANTFVKLKLKVVEQFFKLKKKNIFFRNDYFYTIHHRVTFL
jgi:hypothetical protein